jgi:hypothetical protein
MKKLIAILSLFIMPLRLRTVRLPVDALRSHRLPYR